MQASDGSKELRLTFLCKNPGSNSDDECAAAYRTNRSSVVWQGDSMGPEVASMLNALADHETYLEVPEKLADLFARMWVKERYGVDIPEGPGGVG